MTDFDLRAVARAVIAEDTSEDLGQMIKELRRRIPADAVETALSQALMPFVHDMMRGPSSALGRSRSPQPRSAKVSAIRDAWKRHLDSIRYTVQDGSVRRIGDMDRADVVFVAEQLEAIAKQNKLKSMSMRALAAAMSENDAARVRDLPDDFLRQMFERSAA